VLVLRRQKLIEKLESESITILFSGASKVKTADQHYDFFVNNNFYYLTLLNEPNMALVIIKGKNMQKSFVFKEFRTPERALWDGELLSPEIVKQTSKVDEVRNIETLESFLQSVTSSSRANIFGKLGKLNLDLEASNLDSTSYKFLDKIKDVHPYLQVNNIHMDLASLRMIKDELEIKAIKEAIKTTNAGLNNVMKHLEGGRYEYEMVAHYLHILNLENKKESFKTIAASGKNATILHYVDNNQKLGDNDLMLFDLGVYHDHYASDISRTYPVSGKFTPRQKEVYEIVLKANKETIKMLKPGVTWREFNEFAAKILIEGLYQLGLIKSDEEYRKYYYHSIGHFLGLDVHDIGNYEVALEPGMVVTVEPGLYIAEEGIGIRIEDDILITKDGAINLSKDIIKEIKDIEKFMAK
jgi:Xaa-Pro aminopeptidase